VNRRYEEFTNLTSIDTLPDFFYWITILNYFDKYKEELNEKELKILLDKSEECRVYLNENNTDPIDRADVNPNIYEYYRLHIENNNNNKEYSESYYAILA